MTKYKVSASLDICKEIELSDDLTEQEVEQDLWCYIKWFIDWDYEKVEED